MIVLRSGRNARRAVIRTRSERPLPTDYVEKQRVAAAESGVLNRARLPFCSGFARLLRCRKDLGQLNDRSVGLFFCSGVATPKVKLGKKTSPNADDTGRATS